MTDHVAWLRFKTGNDGRPATIHVCDSDAPGAFKVYRHPADLLARLRWTRDRWDDIVDDADNYAWELFGRPAAALGGLLGGIRAVAENERAACDAMLARFSENTVVRGQEKP